MTEYRRHEMLALIAEMRRRGVAIRARCEAETPRAGLAADVLAILDGSNQ